MSQHFLLSAKARTLSLATVLRLSDDEAYAAFRDIRWAAHDGEPHCPRCGCVAVYEYRTRRVGACLSKLRRKGDPDRVATSTVSLNRNPPNPNLDLMIDDRPLWAVRRQSSREHR